MRYADMLDAVLSLCDEIDQQAHPLQRRGTGQG